MKKIKLKFKNLVKQEIKISNLDAKSVEWATAIYKNQINMAIDKTEAIYVKSAYIWISNSNLPILELVEVGKNYGIKDTKTVIKIISKEVAKLASIDKKYIAEAIKTKVDGQEVFGISMFSGNPGKDRRKGTEQFSEIAKQFGAKDIRFGQAIYNYIRSVEKDNVDLYNIENEDLVKGLLSALSD